MRALLVAVLTGTIMAFSAGAAFASLDTHTLQGKVVYVNPARTVLRMEDGQRFQIPSNLANAIPRRVGQNEEATVTYRIRPNGQKVLTAFFIDQQESR